MTSAPPVMARVPYRTATIVTLAATVADFVLFSVTNNLSFGTDRVGLGTLSFVLYAIVLLLAITCFVTSLVLRSRTKRLGLPRALVTISVVLSSVLLAYILLTAIAFIGVAFLLLSIFFGG